MTSAARCSRASAWVRGRCPASSTPPTTAWGCVPSFTTDEKESRAWTFRAGSTAPECAGRIHTDFQRGFIRAETIHWDVLLEAGSYARARVAGLVRSEGKEYLPVDGDVLEFRFNV